MNSLKTLIPLIVPILLGLFLIPFGDKNDRSINSSERMTVNQKQILEGIFYLDNSPVEISIENGIITNIQRKDKLSDLSLSKTFIAPGLIDHQVNGYLSYSFVGEDLTEEQIRKITEAFWKEGITTFLPTLTSNSFEIIHKNFGILAQAIKDPIIGQSIPGFHLEGPYISPLDGFRGAHPKEHVRLPNWEEFSKWYEAADHKILEVTLAPELEGSIDFVNKCLTKNIVVALGHHNGSADMIKAAADAGATVSTHLGNGCANLIHRHDNPIWPQLADERLAASIIVDGFHLRPEEVNVFYKIKGKENTILVSDIVRLAGSPPGIYEDFGTKVEVTKEGKVMMPSQNVLAGASFLITAGIENIMKFTQCSLGDAINMASKNPAKLLGLEDRGVLRVGKRADLILFTMKENRISITKTIVGGETVFEKD